MIKTIFFKGLMLVVCTPLFSQGYMINGKTIFSKDSIASFPLQQLEGSKTFLHPSSKKILVIAFLSPECPLCKNYSSKLVSIKKKYKLSTDFIGIIPGSFDGSEIAEFQKNYMPSWKLLRDTSLRLTHYLEGNVTPEVLVIDAKYGHLIYKGAIDDWLVSLGKTRNHISKYYLDIALNNFINDRPSIPFTKPVGCLINDF